MKAIAETLGVARSNLVERAAWGRRARPPYRKAGDPELLARIRALVDQRPTYGYRRITALLNRELALNGGPNANHKRVYRIMQRHGLLLERHSGRRPGRIHDGKVVVMRSNLRWCSDGFEFACWNGEIVRVAFVIDAHDREVIGWHGEAGAGISGEAIRDLMLAAVESRFGDPCGATRHRVALRQWQPLHGQGHPRLRLCSGLAALLHPRRQPGEQWPRRGLGQDVQTRLRARQPAAGRPHRAPAAPPVVRRLQRQPPPQRARHALSSESSDELTHPPPTCPV